MLFAIVVVLLSSIVGILNLFINDNEHNKKLNHRLKIATVICSLSIIIFATFKIYSDYESNKEYSNLIFTNFQKILDESEIQQKKIKESMSMLESFRDNVQNNLEKQVDSTDKLTVQANITTEILRANSELSNRISDILEEQKNSLLLLENDTAKVINNVKKANKEQLSIINQQKDIFKKQDELIYNMKRIQYPLYPITYSIRISFPLNDDRFIKYVERIKSYLNTKRKERYGELTDPFFFGVDHSKRVDQFSYSATFGYNDYYGCEMARFVYGSILNEETDNSLTNVFLPLFHPPIIEGILGDIYNPDDFGFLTWHFPGWVKFVVSHDQKGIIKGNNLLSMRHPFFDKIEFYRDQWNRSVEKINEGRFPDYTEDLIRRDHVNINFQSNKINFYHGKKALKISVGSNNLISVLDLIGKRMEIAIPGHYTDFNKRIAEFSLQVGENNKKSFSLDIDRFTVTNAPDMTGGLSIENFEKNGRIKYGVRYLVYTFKENDFLPNMQ